jgi:hypothetical protein
MAGVVTDSERKDPGVVNAIPRLIAVGLVCPSCHGELIPTSLGHACAAEGKFFDPSLVEIWRKPSSLPFALIRGKGELRVNISGAGPEFLEILKGQLSAKGFAFTPEKSGNFVGFKVRSSDLWTYTTVLCRQADGNLEILFSHRAEAVWLRILLVMLFVIPGLLVAIIGGSQMKKNNIRLDGAVLESLQELRKRARSGVKFECPAATEIHEVAAEGAAQPALAEMPRTPGKAQITAGMRFKRFGICVLLAILCAIVGSVTRESARTISELMAWPFFLSLLVGIYQLGAALVALIKRK